MGYYVINNLIKERINKMSKEIRSTINTITHLDSMKAVKVALGLSEANQESINKVMQVVSLIDGNLKELAVKVLELEQRLNVANKGIERIDERSTN